jgi:cell division protein FtsL
MPPLRSFAAYATAAQPAAQPVAPPEPERRPQPAQRAPLRIVAPPDPEAGARRRRRVVAGALAGLACAGLFAIVGVRVLLAQGQGPVDKLESEVTSAQAENQRLRLDVARLESPARIVNEAQTHLGMVPPAAVVYLPPLLAPQPTTAQPIQAQPSPSPLIQPTG